ncbi:hypothetical protein AU476_17060 [Cupriavidus sp. UYMSc13B]|nr:hypothetical protein AU476_17060 [Cupriavidus sp. UYMSc13B]
MTLMVLLMPLYYAGVQRMPASGEDAVPIGFDALGEQLKSRNSALELFAPILPGSLRPSRAAIESQALQLIFQDLDRQQRPIGLQNVVQMHGLSVAHALLVAL